ncbi:hypothetical protein BDV98DRAFT_380400 [Pterulicium gracile]|uniref:Uncharacterized protein n=1 Tax=Pterulicium gracile TaxID=1884261 RepID=A0A5C3QRY3_9AGAR|nr:hypothetical protein BDV98DRAFT_380400 [Pterula gracilis]
MKRVVAGVFGTISLMLLKGADFRKFSRLNDMDKPKGKQKCYEVLSHVYIDKPDLLVRTTCSWFKVWSCKGAMDVLANYVYHQTPAVDPAMTSVDPDIPTLILHDMLEIFTTDGIDNMDGFKYLGILAYLGLNDRPGPAVVDAISGPHAQEYFSLLCTVTSAAMEQLDTDTSDNLRLRFLPAVCALTEIFHMRFSEASNLGPLDGRIAEFSLEALGLVVAEKTGPLF